MHNACVCVCATVHLRRLRSCSDSAYRLLSHLLHISLAAAVPSGPSKCAHILYSWTCAEAAAVAIAATAAAAASICIINRPQNEDLWGEMHEAFPVADHQH